MSELNPLIDPYVKVLEEYFRLVCRMWLARVELELQAFSDALYQSLHDLFQGTTTDWKESLDAFFSEQEAAGRTVAPENRRDLFGFLEGWANTGEEYAASGKRLVQAADNDQGSIIVAGATQRVVTRTQNPQHVDQPFVLFDASRPDVLVTDFSGPPAKVEAALPPPKPRLPADSRGTWIIGTKGNGVFQYNDSLVNRQAGIAGARIRFEGNYIAKGGFPPEAYYGGSAAAASVEITAITGTNADATASDAAMRAKIRNPNWQRPTGYRWHHAGGPGSRTMELVDTKFHRTTAHRGTAAPARAALKKAATARKGPTAKGAGEASAKNQPATFKVGAGKGVSGTKRTTIGPTGMRAASRAMAIVGVYLTVREALQAAGILQPDYSVLTEAQYYFVAEDGSIFVVWSAGWFSSARREFVAGPRKGQQEQLDEDQFIEFQRVAEEQWGKYVPGTIFREPRFIPGRQRSRLPLIDPDRGEVGWIDEKGVHRNPLTRGST